MDTAIRVQICRLLEKIMNDPEYADKIAIVNNSKPPLED